jgi:hypothetical protein
VTANLFTFKNIFEKVGLFNSELISGGDIEWCRRVHSSGYCLKYADNVIVDHPARHNFSQIYEKVMRVTQGRCDMAKIEFSFRKRLLMIIAEDVMPPIQRICNIWYNNHLVCRTDKLKVIGLLLVMKYAVLFKKLSQLFCRKN